jgi:hypothetical protein
MSRLAATIRDDALRFASPRHQLRLWLQSRRPVVLDHGSDEHPLKGEVGRDEA